MTSVVMVPQCLISNEEAINQPSTVVTAQTSSIKRKQNIYAWTAYRLLNEKMRLEIGYEEWIQPQWKICQPIHSSQAVPRDEVRSSFRR